MFQYEYEKRSPSSNSCDSRATMTTATEWSRVYPSGAGSGRSATSGRTRQGQGQGFSEARLANARRPLPPRPILCDRIPSKTSVPLKVWVVAGASCFAVCAVLVLATVVVTRWGAGEPGFAPPQYVDPPEPIYSNPKMKSFRPPTTTTEEMNTLTTSDELEDDLELPLIEKLAIFKNLVANREKIRNNENRRPELSLMSKPQMHPLHDTSIQHEERRIEKKDQAKHPDVVPIDGELDSIDIKKPIPEFKPTLPDVFINRHNEIKLPDGYVAGLRKHDDDFYEEYYNDENLYDDYMQSNTMTNYLIEKVQELHDWITTDPDFELHNPNNGTSKRNGTGHEFKQLLQALNTSLVEGNVSVVMNKLRDIYFGDFNQSSGNHSRKIIVTNGTDLLSFGILTLDVMLLHNIQLMAWESQESSRARMLKDPDVFAFNALFMDPTKVEAKQNDINHYNEKSSKRQNLRQDMDAFDLGKNLLENILEVGLSTARAAIHLGRVYKNTKSVLNQLSNRESLNANIQNQISRNIDANSHALNHLQSSFNKSDNSNVNVANSTPGFYTDLDCVWMLYCKNLVATAKLNAPYGTMARINGMALRMLSGDISADKALDTMLYEAFSGWTELRCNDMFPRCSKVNAASVVMDSILQPLRRSQSNRTR